MRYLIMNLQSKLMSFGCYSKGYDRDTNEFPTRSAIYGIILCSMGKKGKMPEMFKKLNNIKMDIYSYTETNLEKDFQTIGCGWDEETYQYKFLKKCDGSKSSTGSKIFYKYYLSNQHFRVILEIVDDDFANEIANYLKISVWEPYFGRKKCTPDEPIFNGIYNNKEDAISFIEKDNPIYKYSEDIPDENKFIKMITLRDVPQERLNDYDNYLNRRVYVSEY